MSENFNLSSETCVFDKLNSLSYYFYKIFFDKLIYKIIAFSIFCFIFNQLNYAQLYYLFYFALFVIYGFSFCYFIFFDMSNIAENSVFTKDSNIVDFDIYWNIENIFVEQEKQKLVDLLNK